MIVHIDKLIRHLRSQIKEADKIDSEFVYLTKREAEACLELAEAQDVIQEMFKEIKEGRADNGKQTVPGYDRGEHEKGRCSVSQYGHGRV
jgi:hypothetical protein